MARVPTSGPTSGVSVELRTPSGSWVVAAATAGSVGDAPGAAPYLLASFEHGIQATALRVVIHGNGQVSALDVHALGDGGTGQPGMTGAHGDGGRGWPACGAGRLVRRFAGYGLGSVVAAATSEIAFVIAYAFLHAGTVGASLAGFVGGAIPNYILNRRWAWQDRTGRCRRSEIMLYAGGRPGQLPAVGRRHQVGRAMGPAPDRRTDVAGAADRLAPTSPPRGSSSSPSSSSTT